MLRFDKLLVVDLECSCWATPAERQGKIQDIIEVGVCLYDLQTREISDAEGYIVRPERSEISAFCTRLTTITPAMAEHGLPFAQVLDILRTRYQAAERPWGSWGNFDRSFMTGQCRDFALPYPFSDDQLNLKTLYALRHRLAKAPALFQAIRQAGLEWVGQHHRGVDDARNTARLLDTLL